MKGVVSHPILLSEQYWHLHVATNFSAYVLLVCATKTVVMWCTSRFGCIMTRKEVSVLIIIIFVLMRHSLSLRRFGLFSYLPGYQWRSSTVERADIA